MGLADLVGTLLITSCCWLLTDWTLTPLIVLNSYKWVIAILLVTGIAGLGESHVGCSLCLTDIQYHSVHDPCSMPSI